MKHFEFIEIILNELRDERYTYQRKADKLMESDKDPCMDEELKRIGEKIDALYIILDAYGYVSIADADYHLWKHNNRN